LLYNWTSFNCPLFPDLNEDGSLEYFYNNHMGLNKTSGDKPVPTYVYGKIEQINRRPKVQPIDINFELVDNRRRRPDRRRRLQTGRHNDDYRKHVHSDSNIWLARQGASESGNRYTYDSHGGFILDLDNDGYLDLYLNNGGGSGLGVGSKFASVLFWGSRNVGDAKWTLAGGVTTAFDAGLENHGGDGRGRFAYVVDLNGDGLLDVVEMNEQREDGLVRPSRVMYNQGNRLFYPDNNFNEYVQVAIYASNSGVKGGLADSLIIQRTECESSGEFPIEQKFCEEHKGLSWAVYRYGNGRMNLVSEKYPTSESYAENIQTEDINGDGILDFIVSAGPDGTTDLTQPGSIKLYYSSEGNSDFFPGQASEVHLPPKDHVLGSAIMRDFDLDGNMDILAIYKYLKQGASRKYVVAMYSKMPGVTKPPFYKMSTSTQDIPSLSTGLKTSDMNMKDISSIDYNNDGFMDVTFVSSKYPYLYQLTNIFPTRCTAPNYLTIVPQADGTIVNKYGIGSLIRLEVFNRNTDKFEEFFKSVSSYSHATSSRGGASDYRIVFGLGSNYMPTRLIIKWPDGTETSINRGLESNLNNIKTPLIVKYNQTNFERPFGCGCNIAEAKPFEVSSSRQYMNNNGLQWTSLSGDHQWLVIDLGLSYEVVGVIIVWGNTYATDYVIQIYDEGISSWRNVFQTSEGAGGREKIWMLNDRGRYITLGSSKTRNMQGISLFSFEVYSCDTC